MTINRGTRRKETMDAGRSPAEPFVSRETTSTPSQPSGAARPGREDSHAESRVAFGWVLRRVAAIGFAALDVVVSGHGEPTDAQLELYNDIKPVLDTLAWKGKQLTVREQDDEA